MTEVRKCHFLLWKSCSWINLHITSSIANDFQCKRKIIWIKLSFKMIIIIMRKRILSFPMITFSLSVVSSSVYRSLVHSLTRSFNLIFFSYFFLLDLSLSLSFSISLSLSYTLFTLFHSMFCLIGYRAGNFPDSHGAIRLPVSNSWRSHVIGFCDNSIHWRFSRSLCFSHENLILLLARPPQVCWR